MASWVVPLTPSRVTLAFPRRLSDDRAGLGNKAVLRYVIMAACALLLVACATITKGTTQLVAVDTPGAPGATCTIEAPGGPQLVTTPASVTLTKGSASLPIRCTKQCYLSGSSVIPSGTEAMAAGNVVFGALIGLGVDAATGAMNKYADQVTVAMLPDPACRANAPPPAARHTSSL